MSAEQITQEWLESIGFKHEPAFGMVKDIAEGPEESGLAMCVGHYPWNEPAVSLLIGGYGIVLTHIWTRGEIETLLQLLDGAGIDHPDVCEIDEDDLP